MPHSLRLLPVCGLALWLTACVEPIPLSPHAARGPYAIGSPLTASPGRRVVIRDAQGEAIAKWRVRRLNTKIYDRSMRRVGTLRGEEGAWIAAPLSPSAEPVRASLSAGGEGHVGELIYLEPQPKSRLLIKDRQDALIGVITDVSAARDGSELELRSSYASQAPVLARASVAGPTARLERDGRLAMSAPAAHVSPAALMAYELEHESLDPLHRAALARALTHQVAALTRVKGP